MSHIAALASGARACVIGDPIAHSRSPLVHGYWLRELGLDGSYTRERVAAADVERFLGSLAEQGYRGCNVTIPHKEAACRLVARRTELAAALGAVNTIWIDEDGSLVGDNTDVHGFLANLDQEAPGWQSATATAVIIGAGGGARAILAALEARGIARVVIANRSVGRAERMAELGVKRAEAIGLEGLPGALGEADLIVNATALGMDGQPPLDIDLARLKAGAVVADIVYVPLETRFIAAARARGHRVVGGLGMLLHQAVPGFERWFGARPEVTPGLYRHIAADIRPF